MYLRRTKGNIRDDEYCKQLALPEEFRQQILNQFHNLAGHSGVSKMYADIRARYYFPNMYKTIHDYIVSCDSCQVGKRDRHFRPMPLRPMPVCGVLDITLIYWDTYQK